MSVPRNEDPAHEPRYAPDARMAPEPLTADQLALEEEQRRARWRAGAAALLILISFVAIHGAGHIPVYGGWITLLLLIVSFGLSVARRGLSAVASLIRNIFGLWLAITVVIVVLVSLDSFSGENILLLAAVWGILLGLWLVDRNVARILGVRSDRAAS